MDRLNSQKEGHSAAQDRNRKAWEPRMDTDEHRGGGGARFEALVGEEIGADLDCANSTIHQERALAAA